MAQYQSSQTANTGGASTLVITKPTSLAVGDLMVAQIATTVATAATATPPAGWTTLRTDQTFNIFYKLADSADAAATNFTFTFSIATAAHGRVSRFTNVNLITPLDQNNGAYGEPNQFPISTSGITPTVSAGLMLISVMADPGDTRTVSGYVIDTDNPTWTEAFDGYAQGIVVSLAYATRPQLTATGTASATFNTNTFRRSMQIFNVNSVVNASAIALLPVLNAPVPRRVVGPPFGGIATVPTPAIVENKWSNPAKNTASSWTNPDKT